MRALATLARVPIALCCLIGVWLVGLSSAVGAREAGDPIRMEWTEGDVAGMTTIVAPDGGEPIGFVEYHQQRRGDVLETLRISRFRDGSSDEDEAEARIAGDRLEALRGYSIIRDAQGNSTVELTIDVEHGHISGFSAAGGERRMYDEHVALPPGTYWGPLIFIVLKNFDQNAADDRLVFRTVAPTPAPRVIDLELVRRGDASLERLGARLDVARFTLRPTIHWLIDPIIQRIAPKTEFLMRPGDPPALARFDGPRNFGGQEIRLE